MKAAAIKELYFDDGAVGGELPAQSIRLNVPIIIRWCAATEIFTRRDHFDLGYVQKHSDVKDIVAGGVWSNTYVLHYVKTWAGPLAWIWKFKAQTRAHMFPGDVLTAHGTVVNAYTSDGLGYAEVEAGLRREEDGYEVVPARATVVLPLRGGRPVPYPFRP